MLLSLSALLSRLRNSMVTSRRKMRALGRGSPAPKCRPRVERLEDRVTPTCDGVSIYYTERR
jgi:hypothetical protein